MFSQDSRGFCSLVDIRRPDGVAGAPLDLLADDGHDDVGDDEEEDEEGGGRGEGIVPWLSAGR